MIQHRSEGYKFGQYRPEQIRLFNNLTAFGFAANMEVAYTVYDDLNGKEQQYIADIMLYSKPRTVIEVQGPSHDSDKGMLKTKRKKELTEKAGYNWFELDAEMCKEYPLQTLIDMVVMFLKGRK